jgi:hypothetical protein
MMMSACYYRTFCFFISTPFQKSSVFDPPDVQGKKEKNPANMSNYETNPVGALQVGAPAGRKARLVVL